MGGFVFHVMNRGATGASCSRSARLRRSPILRQALTKRPIRLLNFCAMPNHFHLLAWPETDTNCRFMHWLTGTQRVRGDRERHRRRRCGLSRAIQGDPGADRGTFSPSRVTSSAIPSVPAGREGRGVAWQSLAPRGGKDNSRWRMAGARPDDWLVGNRPQRLARSPPSGERQQRLRLVTSSWQEEWRKRWDSRPVPGTRWPRRNES